VLPSVARRSHNDLDVATECGEKGHQTLRGEAGQPAAQQMRHFRLIYAENA
jgi:hypothetical protein